MPLKPKKPCRYPGCPNLTIDCYCNIHDGLYKREGASKRGYTSKWRKLSKLYLKEHPLCLECHRQGKLMVATVVDHVIPHRGDEKLMWDNCNWQALCKRCHDKKTRKYDQLPEYKYRF